MVIRRIVESLALVTVLNILKKKMRTTGQPIIFCTDQKASGEAFRRPLPPAAAGQIVLEIKCKIKAIKKMDVQS